MSLIRPFKGLRPAAGRAAEVLAPPYDVLSSEEARLRAHGKPFSFLHISKPEIDLPEDIDPYDARVYAKAAENMRRMVQQGVLVADAVPCYYAYRLTWRGRPMTGIVAGASVADYDTNRIRKHEYTRPKKEDDRVRQIEAVNAQTGPVMLAYPDAPAVDALVQGVTQATAAMDVLADDGVRHQLWVIDDRRSIDQLTALFDAMPALYIADGHHRSAAASRVCAALAGPADAPERSFLAVIFPHHEMRILDYNRIIRDLNGMSPEGLLAAVSGTFKVAASEEPVVPVHPGQFGMYVSGHWYRLDIRPELIPADPVKSLDVSLLADHLIEPVLGISDPRNDERIDFVGGIRGVGELMERVDSGQFAVAFSMHPTRMEALMAVAEAGEVMPPKSTWFEPKLADGVVSLVFASN